MRKTFVWLILFYQIFLFLYRTGIYVVSLWNPKAKLWIKGRIFLFSRLKKNFRPGNEPVVWMHCASLGEFEQGRPLLLNIQEKYPRTKIILTFFSPSGYEIVKRKNIFSHVYYLPVDSYMHARKWMNLVKPTLVIWVKYEYWYYYLTEIKRRNIPLLMVSGVYLRSQPFFKWYGSLYRKMLSCFTHFFVQNTSSARYLRTVVSKEKITIAGDTRCDRVIQIAENFKELEGITEFCGAHRVVVAGSTWEDDEAVWAHYIRTQTELRFIVAPHEIDQENLEQVKKMLDGSILYSEWLASGRDQDINCLIIDNIGMLSSLYRYATLTYVGGGFGADGLHNILEAAVYGKPVLFGPAISKNFEAGDLIDCFGAISINHALELEETVDRLLADEEEILRRGEAAKKYVYMHAGATSKIMDYIQSKLSLKYP